MGVANLIHRMVIGIRRKYCLHEFLLRDLETTEIPYPEEPGKDATLKERIAYEQSLYTCDAHTKRVKWPCRKCGEVFFAHCGLDISPEHGMIVGR